MGSLSTVSRSSLDIFIDDVKGLILKRAENEIVELAKRAASDMISTKKGDGVDNQKNEGDMHRYTRKADDEQLLDSIKSLREPYNPGVTWDSLAGLRTTKQELQIAVEMPRRQPQLFIGGLKACQFILLYGPPGNGKTHLARVIASNLQSTLYIVSASDLTSMWIGSSARLVRLLFEDARAHKPAIIFFDEVDSICGQRRAFDSVSHSEQKAELLAQMDGARADNKDVLFIGATNLPWVLDPAFLRRFTKQLYIPLPDYDTRVQLLSIRFEEIVFVSEAQRNELLQDYAKRTDGFSGSDIKRLIQEILQIRLRKVEAATHFRFDKVQRLHYPCDKDHPKAEEMSWRQAQNGTIGLPVITDNDLNDVFKKIKPSVKEKHLAEYAEWIEKNESG